MPAIRQRNLPAYRRSFSKSFPERRSGARRHEDKGAPEIIASLSVGVERQFAFGVGTAMKCKEVFRMRLAHNSLLLIGREANEALKHRIVVERRITEPRVNITLRRFPSYRTEGS